MNNYFEYVIYVSFGYLGYLFYKRYYNSLLIDLYDNTYHYTSINNNIQMNNTLLGFS
jgi:hypothetical protein